MLSNAFFLQNFVLIQPRTSPPKIYKILQKKNANLVNLPNFSPSQIIDSRAARAAAPRGPAPGPARARRRGRAGVGVGDHHQRRRRDARASELLRGLH